MFFIVGFYIEIDRTVRFVCESVIEDFLYQLFLFDDVTSSMWFDRWW